MLKITHFGGVALSLIEEHDQWTVEGRNALVVLRDGAFDQDGQTLVLKPYTLTRSFQILDSIDTAEDALLAKMAQGRWILKGVQRDGTTYRQTWAKLLTFQREAVQGTLVYSPVTLTFLIDLPYWYATADEPTYLDGSKVLDGSWTLTANKTSLALTALSTSSTITYSGTVKTRRGYIEIIPRAGASITNPRVRNAANGMMLAYTGTIANPDRLEYDLLPMSCKLNYTTNAWTGVTLWANQMDMMALEVGANVITVECDAITGTVDLFWYWGKAYL